MMRHRYYLLVVNICLIKFLWADTEETFTKIYEEGAWGTNRQGVGHSDAGSTKANTHIYRSFLANFMKEYHITSVIDVGCGDWEFSQCLD